MSETKSSNLNRLKKTIGYKTNKYKIFELKYGKRKLSNVWKYNQLRLVLAVFVSICDKLVLNYIKQARCSY